MKKIGLPAIALLMFLGSSGVMAEGLKVGASIEALRAYEYEDQFEESRSINADTRTLIITFEKDVGGFVDGYLSKQDKDYLSRNKIQYIADISRMPSLVASMFAIPKMQEYKHIILLNDEDDFQEVAPRKEGKVTVIGLDEAQKVVSIDFVETKDPALESALGVEPAEQ